MIKARQTVIFTVDYEIHPENYPEGLTEQEMLTADIQNTKDDPWLIMETTGCKLKVVGEILKEEQKQ